MSFYLRKSVSFGPLRFNLSKSGIGVSAGIKGLRFGSGPRGNYVHMGRGGLYYRSRYYSPSGSPARSRPLPAAPRTPEAAFGEASMSEIESAAASQMVDSSSESLLAEFDAKRKKIRLAPLVTWLGIVAACAAVALPQYRNLGIAVAVVAAVLIPVAVVRDKLAKTVVLLYDMTPEFEERYRKLHDAMDKLASANAIWHVTHKGRTPDAKYFAGANELIRRTPIRPRFSPPPFVKTNLPTPSIPVGRQTLYFFPDRLLVFDSKKVGAVSYNDLELDIGEISFIEDGGVPSDAVVVDHTWKYVSKKGGPDRRFRDNRQLPVARYQTVHLRSRTGLNELVHISKLNLVQPLNQTIRDLVAEMASVQNENAGQDIKFSCPACQGHLIVEVEAAGMSVSCPHCGKTIGMLKKESPKRVCSHCGSGMLAAPAGNGRSWECLTCHNTLNESGSGDRSGFSVSISTESGPRDLITDKQKQFLVDLGETMLPRFKDEASERIDSLIGRFDSWLAACFRKRDVLERPDQRRLQIGVHKANLAASLPKYGVEFSDQHRLHLQQFVKDTIGADLFLSMGPVGITKNAEALDLHPRKQKEKLLTFLCPFCNQKYEAPEEMADSVLDCQKCGKQTRLPRPPRGYYAAPSEPQLEEAELYGLDVRAGMHRGKMKDLLATASNDRTRTPSNAAYEHYHQRKIARQIREAEETIAEATAKLRSLDLAETEIDNLRRTLEEARSLRAEIVENEHDRKEDEKRFAKEDAQLEADSQPRQP